MQKKVEFLLSGPVERDQHISFIGETVDDSETSYAAVGDRYFSLSDTDDGVGFARGGGVAASTRSPIQLPHLGVKVDQRDVDGLTARDGKLPRTRSRSSAGLDRLDICQIGVARLHDQ